MCFRGIWARLVTRRDRLRGDKGTQFLEFLHQKVHFFVWHFCQKWKFDFSDDTFPGQFWKFEWWYRVELTRFLAFFAT